VYIQFTSTYHNESNWEIENRNKGICKYFKLLCNNNQGTWDYIFSSVLWVRTCKYEKTMFSNFKLLYGRRELELFELMINLDKNEDYESKDKFLIRRFTKHYMWINEAIKNIETANKLCENRSKQMKRLRANYNPDDLVLVKLIKRRKLNPFFVGFMKII